LIFNKLEIGPACPSLSLKCPGLPTLLGLTCAADRAHVKRHEKGLGEEGVQGADCAGMHLLLTVL